MNSTTRDPGETYQPDNNWCCLDCGCSTVRVRELVCQPGPNVAREECANCGRELDHVNGVSDQ